MATAIGNLVAAMVFDAERARIVVVIVIVFSNLAGGFFVDLDGPNVPWWLRGVHNLSFQTYTFGLYVRNSLSADEFAAFHSTLDRYSFSEQSNAVNISVLVGLAAVLRYAAYLIVLTSRNLRFS